MLIKNSFYEKNEIIRGLGTKNSKKFHKKTIGSKSESEQFCFKEKGGGLGICLANTVLTHYQGELPGGEIAISVSTPNITFQADFWDSCRTGISKIEVHVQIEPLKKFSSDPVCVCYLLSEQRAKHEIQVRARCEESRYSGCAPSDPICGTSDVAVVRVAGKSQEGHILFLKQKLFRLIVIKRRNTKRSSWEMFFHARTSSQTCEKSGFACLSSFWFIVSDTAHWTLSSNDMTKRLPGERIMKV